MKYLVVGTGAVGGYFGYVMVKGGLDVTFVSRGRILERINEKGLTVISDGTEDTVQLNASEEPEGQFDVAIVSVKSHHTSSLIPLLQRVIPEGGTAITLQNGLGNEEKLANGLPGRTILGGIAYISADVPEPGKIIQIELAKMAFGPMNLGQVPGTSYEGMKETADRIATELVGAGMDAKALDDIAKRKWSKLVWNAAFNPLTAITGLGTGEAALDENTAWLAEQAMNEVIAVARAEGYDLEYDIQDSIERTKKFTGGRTSMLQDLHNGKELELESINGEVIRRAKKHNIPVPLNSMLYTLLISKSRLKDRWSAMDDGKKPAGPIFRIQEPSE